MRLLGCTEGERYQLEQTDCWSTSFENEPRRVPASFFQHAVLQHALSSCNIDFRAYTRCQHEIRKDPEAVRKRGWLQWYLLVWASATQAAQNGESFLARTSATTRKIPTRELQTPGALLGSRGLGWDSSKGSTFTEIWVPSVALGNHGSD